MLLNSWYAAHSTTKLATEVATEVAAGVLPKGCWIFSTSMLGVLALSKEGVLGVDLHTIEYLMRCVFNKYSKLVSIKYYQSC